MMLFFYFGILFCLVLRVLVFDVGFGIRYIKVISVKL